MHDRMPVMLTTQHEAAWLDTEGCPPEKAVSILKPYSARLMRADDQDEGIFKALSKPKDDAPQLQLDSL